MSASTRSCEFCDKRGLPVIPVRYALAETIGRVPKLTAPMSADEVAAIPDSSKAQYTARLLRSGYLYTYDEARKRWEGYFINDGGYYLRFDLKQPMSPALAKGRAPCTDEGHQEIASCITIRDPKNATKVWFGFSDVEWTPAVLEKHAAADYRKRHMRLLDVKAWLSSKQQPHAKPIEKIADTIAEYTRLMLPHKSAFGWSPFKFNNRQTKTESLIKTAEQLAPNGLILGIPDPAGVAQELAALMSWRADKFLTAPERARQLANLSTISSLEQAIKMQAQSQVCADVNAYANQIDQGPSFFNPNPALIGMPGDPIAADRVRNMLTAASLDEHAEETWGKYKQYYDEGARTAWAKQYKTEAEAFEQSAIAPLAQAHVAWMQSPHMSHYFDCNYDRKNWEVSKVYIAVVTACIENTQDKQICHKLYTGWLEKSQATDAQNILAKALKFNHDSIEDAIKQVPEQALDYRALPLDNVIEIYNAAILALGRDGADQIARLITHIAGPAAKVLSKALDGVGGTAFVAIMSGISGQKMVKLTFTGKRSEFRRVIVRELLKGAGQFMTPKELNRAVLAEMNRLRIRNGKLPDGTLNRTWFAMIDPKALNKASTAEEATAALRTMQQFEDMAQHNWRTTFNANVRIGVVTGIVQVVCLTKLFEDEAKAMGHEKTEAAMRLGFSMAAVAGTFAEAAGGAMETMVKKGVVLKAGRGWSSVVANVLKLGGKSVGAIAGGVLAGLDGMKAYEEGMRANYGAAALYFGSAVFGFSIAVGILFLWGPAIIFALVLGLVLITVGIELIKPNKRMEWLQRSYWGKGPGNWGSVEKDQSEFGLAMKEW